MSARVAAKPTSYDCFRSLRPQVRFDCALCQRAHPFTWTYGQPPLAFGMRQYKEEDDMETVVEDRAAAENEPRPIKYTSDISAHHSRSVPLT